MKAELSRSAFATWHRRVLVILFWLAVWEIAYLLIDRDIYFPSPVSVVMTFFRILAEKNTWIIVGLSTYRTLFAIVASAVLGVVIGIVCGLRRTMYDFVNPLMVILKSTPVVSVIIISIIWFRSTDVPIFSGFLMCFPIVFTGTVAGVRSADPKLIEMCRFYGVGRVEMLKSLYFPSAKPYINASVISIVGICWKAVAAAEVLSMPRLSIGANLYFAKTSLDPALLFAWTAIIILLSFVFETIYAKVSGYDKTFGHQ
ncbi:MAG: ABC transporter permease [Firmicutes bacterium HGW-Firmicutes-16]|nr:MAG: ABC transporter permease [Firmicutes bacterium HGW-Firmicutes-16]